MMPVQLMACLSGIINSFRNPDSPVAQKESILILQPEPQVESLIRREFPGAHIHIGDLPSIETGSNRKSPLYDYIYAGNICCEGATPDEILPWLLKALKKDGILYIGVYGIAGYSAPLMLAAAARILSRENPARPLREALDIVQKNIPESHLFNLQHRFIDSYMGDAGREEIRRGFLREDLVFSVSRLCRMIRDCGGRHLNWILPCLYNPRYFFDDAHIQKKISRLNPLDQAAVSELILSFPLEHHLLICRDDCGPGPLPAQDSNLLKRIPRAVGDNVPGQCEEWLPEPLQRKLPITGDDKLFIRLSTGLKNIGDLMADSGLLLHENEGKKRDFVMKLVDLRLITLW